MGEKHGKLTAYLSAPEAWSLSLGTSVGWGCLVITCSTYLSTAGPLGTVLGLIIGAVVIVVVGRSYTYLMSRFPDAGGVFSYTKEAFGDDFGILAVWFTILTYFAMLWANATSLPLYARIFLGDTFQVGRLYSVFGYDVYAAEIVLSVCAVALTCLACSLSRKAPARLNLALALVFVCGIGACFVWAMVSHASSTYSFEPLFTETGSPLTQVVRIASISPWAFIGFENISHSAEEFAFGPGKARVALRTSLLVSCLLYVFVTLLSVSAYPQGFSSWSAYLDGLSDQTGIEALPAFFAARLYMGQAGVVVLAFALLALVVTSLIGNTIALSRMFFALSRDGMLPHHLSRLNRHRSPVTALLLVLAPSCIVPLLGRVAIGWIVDVTTIGATIVYGLVAASCLRLAHDFGDTAMVWVGRVGLAAMSVFGFLILAPNLISSSSLEPESYFIFIVWSVVGLVFFQILAHRDTVGRFGQSSVVWVVLFALMALASVAWAGQASFESALSVLEQTVASAASATAPLSSEEAARLVSQGSVLLRSSYSSHSLAIVVLFFIMVVCWVKSFTKLRLRAADSERQLGHMRSVAYIDGLTRLRNRYAWAEWEEGVDRRMDSGEQATFGVCVCDLNDLKRVNDSLGHVAGDAYIQAASRRICKAFEHSPVFRTGGDEFVVFLQGEDLARHEELMRMLEDMPAPEGEPVPVIASGFSVVCADDHSLRPVFERADERMYERKLYLKSRR